MDDEVSSDLQKCLSEDGQMETDEGPLINENSNGLSHLLTEGEFNSVDAVVADESSTSNQDSQKTKMDTDFEQESISEMSNDVNSERVEEIPAKMDDESATGDDKFAENLEATNDSTLEQDTEAVQNDTLDEASETAQLEIPESNKLEKNQQADQVVVKSEPDTENPESPLKEKLSIQIKKEIKDEDDDYMDQKPKEELKELKDGSVDQKLKDELKVDIKKEIKTEGGGAEETEVVSEDELPTVQKPSVKDAENVSDDELPGPKPADLPADTEVVSEDELPASKKESRKRKPDEERDGYDPGSPTSESESSNKKQAVAKNGESKPVPAEKRSSIDEKPKKKTLPELDKYWKVVNDDPTDFTGWTYLLQYVDQESDVEAAREAYDAFLSHYPYCYGYWRKYADYEKRKGSKKKCLEVLERGLKGIPLSVDLWIHYLNHIKSTRAEDHAFIRSQYERAIEACGLEFRSDRLWESYIKWEAENGSALNVTSIYDRLLATPTLGYTSHFDNFQEHVMSEPVTGVVTQAELVRLRGEVRDAAGAQPQLDLPPGEDEPVDHVASEEEAQAIKERIIAARRKVHKTTGEEVAARWAFEEGIKRPYFHVKPLERCQLKNWKAYLEWEKQHGSFRRALVLHERCLIACALYEEFWMRVSLVLNWKAHLEWEKQHGSFRRALVLHERCLI
ncbi:pre-mRNA-processing factor 39-like, partial [Ostrinia furnacalis]|uniref:pre-mRNA-processing factor 39-like n=1 Tax=Ostrinia furnacalis TaxID=93504 RepID=UPI00103BAF40